MAHRKLETRSDALLVRVYRLGKAKALEVLMKRYRKRLLWYITAIAGNVFAEDILQDTWKEVIKAILDGRYREEGQFWKYIKDIAFRHANRQHNREKIYFHYEEWGPDNSNPGDDGYEIADDAPDEAELLIKQQTDAGLLNGFRHLNLLEKQVIVMYALHGKAFKEIARLLHITSLSTLRNIYARALKKLLPYLL